MISHWSLFLTYGMNLTKKPVYEQVDVEGKILPKFLLKILI